MFYEVWQNNSGGFYLENIEDGIAPVMLIEAYDDEHLDIRVETITKHYQAYCECCGPRWLGACVVYETNINEYIECSNDDEDAMPVHFLDGTIKYIKEKSVT